MFAVHVLHQLLFACVSAVCGSQVGKILKHGPRKYAIAVRHARPMTGIIVLCNSFTQVSSCILSVAASRRYSMKPQEEREGGDHPIYPVSYGNTGSISPHWMAWAGQGWWTLHSFSLCSSMVTHPIVSVFAFYFICVVGTAVDIPLQMPCLFTTVAMVTPRSDWVWGLVFITSTCA